VARGNPRCAVELVRSLATSGRLGGLGGAPAEALEASGARGIRSGRHRLAAGDPQAIPYLRDHAELGKGSLLEAADELERRKAPQRAAQVRALTVAIVT
jgi:hypothetical protein